MQKFTRPLTREIEVAGERLALTLGENGVSVRPVGSRKPPRELSWASLLCLLLLNRSGPGEPTAEEVAKAVAALKGGTAPQPAGAAKPSPPAEAAAPPPTPATNPGHAVPVTALLERLGRWLEQHRPRFAERLKRGATSAELDALQTTLGRPLPEELRAFLSWHAGQDDEFTGAFEGHWYLMEASQAEAAWKELTGAVEGQRRWQPAWIPFLDDDRGNYFFLDTSQAGAPVRQFWERNPEEARTVASSLTAWLEDFVAALERGEYAEDPERGTFTRQHKG
jgi:cell wall assembly regulator SMI1